MKLITLAEQVRNRKRDLHNLLDDNLVLLNKLYQQNGHELRIVGGAVRDILMDKTPKDIDLATDATPEESMDLLKSNNIKVIETGLQHGTVVAHIDGEDYEITTLRIDRETDGRHATVEFTKNWELDAERRDLTFNAMSMDFDGNLYDYHGGHEDLKSGKARFVGDTNKRVQEDYLRILRYFRFQGRMETPNFDSKTLRDIKANAGGLQNISGERIWSEFSKILSGNHVTDILNQMIKTDVAKNIGLPSPNIKEINKVKSNTNNSNLLMAAALKNVEELDNLRSRWKFSNSEYDIMKFILKYRDKDIGLNAARKMFILLRLKDKQLMTSLLEYQGRGGAKAKFNQWAVPEFPINGNDLNALGIRPGPEM